MYTEKINRAIQKASILHKDQTRKGEGGLPYITHLVAVAMIAMNYTEDEDVIVAALLHDTIEDTPYTAEELKNDFGESVCQAVLGVSEPQSTTERHYGWKERKEVYSTQLQEAPIGSLLVSAADKIHNMSSIINEYANSHELFVTQFGGSLNDRITMYQDIANILNDRLENDIVNEFNRVFADYKSFIQHVQANFPEK